MQRHREAPEQTEVRAGAGAAQLAADLPTAQGPRWLAEPEQEEEPGRAVEARGQDCWRVAQVAAAQAQAAEREADPARTPGLAREKERISAWQVR